MTLFEFERTLKTELQLGVRNGAFRLLLYRYIYAVETSGAYCLLFGSFLQSTRCRRFRQRITFGSAPARVSPKVTFMSVRTKADAGHGNKNAWHRAECDLLMQDVSISTSKKKSLAERDFSFYFLRNAAWVCKTRSNLRSANRSSCRRTLTR